MGKLRLFSKFSGPTETQEQSVNLYLSEFILDVESDHSQTFTRAHDKGRKFPFLILNSFQTDTTQEESHSYDINFSK